MDRGGILMRLMGRCAVGLCIAALCSVALVKLASPAAALQRHGQATPADTVIPTAARVVLHDVNVIDGTGAAERTHQDVVIANGRVESFGAANASAGAVPAGTQVIALSGDTVIPGLVGMHDHMFYPSGRVPVYNEMAYSFPRLYLAAGVTTIRTTGAVEPYTDLGLAAEIREGRMPGPHIFVTGPYLEGPGAYTPNMHELTGPEDARRTVAYWADEGVTSFKAYMHITRAELSAALAEAHRRGLKLTGHLCSIGFREAAELGIDNLEHGLMVDTEFDPGKAPDQCPSQQLTAATLAKMDVEGAEIQQTIRELVQRHVAVTSTMPVFETFAPNRPPLETRVLEAMLPQARIDYLTRRAMIAESHDSPWQVLLSKEMQFERDFVRAGGLLLAGEDPTGYGGVLAGYGDQRELELLVEAGFTVPQAVQIATANGARFLGIADRTGSLRPGLAADLVAVRGDLGSDIHNIENVAWVFKDGVAFDSVKLQQEARGSVGLH
jgi:imidazolonepropionase-like amidohydrolase